MEKALETFRENKEAILAALPKEIVEAYYPDRVAVGDIDMLPDMFKPKESEEMATVIQFPKTDECENSNNFEEPTEDDVEILHGGRFHIESEEKE
jgi:hypothetical protein